jgi:hypothetical protein
MDGTCWETWSVTIEENEIKNLVTFRIAPVLDSLSSVNNSVLVPPFPRYVYGNCCKDTVHAPNVNNKGNPENILVSHAKLTNTMKKEVLKMGNTYLGAGLMGCLTKNQQQGLEEHS